MGDRGQETGKMIFRHPGGTKAPRRLANPIMTVLSKLEAI